MNNIKCITDPALEGRSIAFGSSDIWSELSYIVPKRNRDDFYTQRTYSEISHIDSERINLVDSHLSRLRRECSVNNWDGYGALPISMAVVQKTRNFLVRELSQLVMWPDIMPEPSGNIMLEWDNGNGYNLIARITPNGDIAYNLREPRNGGGWNIILSTEKVGSNKDGAFMELLKKFFPCN